MIYSRAEKLSEVAPCCFLPWAEQSRTPRQGDSRRGENAKTLGQTEVGFNSSARICQGSKGAPSVHYSQDVGFSLSGGGSRFTNPGRRDPVPVQGAFRLAERWRCSVAVRESLVGQ